MKAGEEDGVEVDDLIGGVVIGDRVTAKVRTETCPLFWKRSDTDAAFICAGVGFSRLAAASKRTESRNAIVRSADQNLSAFCCRQVWHYRRSCRNRKSSCRFLRLRAARSMSTIECLSGPKKQNE